MMVNVETGAPGASILDLGQLRAGSGCVVWFFKSLQEKKRAWACNFSCRVCALRLTFKAATSLAVLGSLIRVSANLRGGTSPSRRPCGLGPWVANAGG